jgi:predicted phage terminase large subunit-like protein
LSFGYLDHDRHLDKFQGAEFQFVGFDEATQIREDHYRYLFSRLRKRHDLDVPLRMRAASNPGGVSHDFFKLRFLADADDPDRLYIPARIDDNPSLDREKYEKSLHELDPLTRQRLLAGDWDAVPDGGMFRRDWFPIVESWQAPPDGKRVRFWDRASTIPTPGTDPDWTVGALVSQSRGVWTVHDLQRFRGASAENERRIAATAASDGRGVTIYMEQEPGSAGKDVIDHYARNVLRGYSFKSQRPTGKKHERAAPVASAAEMGNVRLVSGRWVPAFLDEAAAFPMGAHDDQIDAVAGAFSVLTKKYVTRSIRILGL